MTVQDICIHLGISRSSYYRWKKNLMKKDHPKRHLKNKSARCAESTSIDMDIEKSQLY